MGLVDGVLAIVLSAALAGAPVQQADLVVGGPTGLPSLAAALEVAAHGDVIHVLPGSYIEGGLVVERAVTIIGRDWPVVKARAGGGIFRIAADSVVIRGLVLAGVESSHTSDHAAILFDGVRACEASGNRIRDSFFGIYLAKASDCRIERNVIEASETRESSAGNGIHLWGASDVRVKDNVVRGQRDGIYLEHVTGAVITGNLSEENVRYGLHFMFSSDNRYVGNTFRDNGAGVAVMYSTGVTIEDNDFEDNWGATAYGLLLKEISDSRIEGNRITGNTTGLSSEGSQRVQVLGNRFVRNGWAARVWSNSQQNLFANNSFIDNAFDVTTNGRQNFNRFEGNYWSRYTGYDLDGDGVGDVPHRPVRLFSLLVERSPSAMMLLRSAFVDLLDMAERVMPVLTPQTLVDDAPLMVEAT